MSKIKKSEETLVKSVPLDPTVNWYEKDIDEIYNHFDSLNDDDGFIFLNHLLQNFPDLQIDWIDLFADVVNHLLNEARIEEVKEFIDLYRITFPGVYESQFQYIEKELINHFIYNGDKNSLLRSIDLVKNNPVPGSGTITKVLLFKLIYHGYYDIALDYSKAVWKPLFDAEDLFGNPHEEFCFTIYLNELESCYNRIKKGETIDVKLLRKDLGLSGTIGSLKNYQNIINIINSPINKDEIKRESFTDRKKFLLFLNIQFMKFMKEEHNIPFNLSDRFFNLFQAPELFGKVDLGMGFFYIPYPVLSEHYDSHLDKWFNLNGIEIFGKVFGLKYVYSFLHLHNLIDDNYYSMMKENIHYLEYEFMVNFRETLWRMMFVFEWPELNAYESFKATVFSDSYHYSTDNQAEEAVNDYLKSFIIPDRIQHEIDVHNEKKEEVDSLHGYDYDKDYSYSHKPVTPIVNSGPKAGRNDPCPCGSGKKYKKCCLDK